MPSGTLDLTDFQGLVTAPGLLMRSPASCLQATNWEFPAPGVIRKRRGIRRLDGNAGGPVWKLLTSRLMGDNLLVHIGTGTNGTQLRYGDGSAALATLNTVDSGNLTRPRETRMQMAVCQRNHYCTSNEAVARVESDIAAAVPVRYAGMPRGTVLNAAGVAAGSALANGYARAYRVTWHRLDADGVELGGAPTSRLVVANTVYMGGGVGAAAANIEFMVPWEWGTIGTALTTAYYWKLWGTRTYNEAGGALGDDEMYLVATRVLTGAEITAGFVVYVDDTPDSFLVGSPRLHTNLVNFPPLEAGIRQGLVNEDAPPPIANDVAYWQDCMWYADTARFRSVTAAMVSLMADGDTVTFTTTAGAVTLTARNAPAGVNDFLRFTAGPTTAINIRETTRFMLGALKVRSLALGLGVLGYSTGTTTTQPGLFTVELTKQQAQLQFTASVPAQFQAYGGYQLNTDASDDAKSNGLIFSKPLRADAVPPINELSAGPKDARILRAVPYRDRLLLFTDYGIYQVTGRTFADFAVNPFDTGYRLIGREHVALCDERVYAWCFEGMVEIDDGGVRVISTPIEPTIEALLVTAGSNDLESGRTAVAQAGFTVAYRNQHQVRFHYPSLNDTSVNGSFAWLAFDTRTRMWAQGQWSTDSVGGFPDNRSCGAVRVTDDLLALGNWSSGADTYLFLERRAYVAADFNDQGPAGDVKEVSSTLVLQYQVPDAKGAQHWQQTVLSWDAEEVSWRTLPTSFALTHTTEADAGTPTTVTVSEVLTRVEPPTANRRGNRLQLTLTHAIAEYAGIVGVSQSYRMGSRFARRVTP